MTSLLIYIMIFFIVTVSYKLSIILKRNNKYIGYIILKMLSFAIIVIFSCFRFNVGTDYLNYTNLYEVCGNIKFEDIFHYRIEPGMIILYKISYYFSDNPIAIIFNITFLTLLFTYILLSKIEKEYPNKVDTSLVLLTFLTIFLPFCFNGMRQGLAIVLGLLSILHFIKKEYKYSLLYLIFAFLFHESAMIIAVYYGIIAITKRKKITSRIILATIVFCTIILFMTLSLTNIPLFEKYKSYLSNNVGSINISYIYIFILNSPLLLLTIIEKKYITDEDSTLISLWISSQILYLSCSYFTYLNRLSLYFEALSIIIGPKMIENNTNKNNRFILKVIYNAYLCIYFYIHFYLLESHGIFPYQNILFMGK